VGTHRQKLFAPIIINEVSIFAMLLQQLYFYLSEIKVFYLQNIMCGFLYEFSSKDLVLLP